jgi:transcriptional regulator with XRE-family HTH domain
MDDQGVIKALRKLCQSKSQAQVAADIGVSPSYLSDVLGGRRAPGPKVLDALGLVRSTVYRPAAV